MSINITGFVFSYNKFFSPWFISVRVSIKPHSTEIRFRFAPWELPGWKCKDGTTRQDRKQHPDLDTSMVRKRGPILIRKIHLKKGMKDDGLTAGKGWGGNQKRDDSRRILFVGRSAQLDGHSGGGKEASEKSKVSRTLPEINGRGRAEMRRKKLIWY